MNWAGKAALAAALLGVQGLLHAEPEQRSTAALMAALADPDFKTREQAQRALTEWGREHLEEGMALFYDAYRNAEDPEVQARARELLRELVIIKQADQGEGYMGIRMQAEDVLVEGGGLRQAVRITEVLEGNPAERAGLKVNDLITGIDDMNVEGEDPLTAFGDYVKQQKPRTDVTLHLLRNGQAIDVRVNLMRRPPGLPDRTFLWGGEEYVPPPQEEVEEQEFREWLQMQRDAENGPK